MRTIHVSPEFPLNRRMRKAVRRGISVGTGWACRTFSSPLVCMADNGAEVGGWGDNNEKAAKQTVRIRLKNDPQRGGWATDERDTRGGRVFRKILMDSGRREWIPEDQLEFGGGDDSPLDLLKAGKVSAPSHLRRALLHIRLFGRLADMIYSMEATNTDFYPHQFKPVLKLLRSPARGILIADEVGLGKTIEAGLIWTELRARYDSRRMLVFCPAILREKWRDELTLKMGLHPHVCRDAREVLTFLRSGEHRERGFVLVCGQQGLRPPRDWDEKDDPRSRLAQFLRDSRDDPPIDFLVVDEAQHIRNSESRTYAVGRLLRGASHYAAFLSATPLANRNLDLFKLLNLLDEGAFERERDFENVLNANQPVVDLRDRVLRDDEMSARDFHAGIAEARGHSLLQDSEQLAMLQKERLDDVRLSRETRARLAERLEHVNLLGHAVTRTRKRDIGDRAKRSIVDEILTMTEAEQNVYELITREAAEAVRLREGPAEFFLMTPQRQMASSMVSALAHWRGKVEDWEAGEWDDEEDEGGAAALTVAAEIYRNNREQLDALEPDLRANDSKFNRLAENLDAHFKDHPPEKAIVFSTFPGTLEYLRERLAKSRPQWGSDILRGGGQAGEKMETVERFREDDNARILFSTEVGGEGIDLQFCRLLVNYDLPWNPMRIEQRIGRIDRIGQKSKKIIVWNLLHKGTIDERIYRAVGTKEWLSRRALGDAEAVIAGEFRQLTRELLTGGLSPKEQEARLKAAGMAVANCVQAAEQLEKEAAHLIAHGDYLLRQIKDARDKHRWITPEDLAAYVGDFLRAKCAGSVFRRLDDEGRHELALSSDCAARFRRFIEERKTVGSGLVRGGRPVRVCFDSRNAGHRRGAETITHAHPLVRFAADETERGDENLRPAIAAQLSRAKSPDISDDTRPGVYMLVGMLWNFKSGPQRIEKMAFRGRGLGSPNLLESGEGEALAIAAANHGEYWPRWRDELDGETVRRIGNELFAELDAEHRAFDDGLRAEAKDRAEIQRQSVRRQAEREESAIRSAIATLREKGRERMIPLQERRLEFVGQRLKSREEEITASERDIRSGEEEVFAAVILVK